MFESKEKGYSEDLMQQDFSFKKEDGCVTINIFTKCDKKHPWKKEEKLHDIPAKKKEENCVSINIFTECEE